MSQPKHKAHMSQLLSVMRDHNFVRLSRRFETGYIRGYVLNVGPRFFLLALVSDRIRFDGFECFRVSDIKSLRPDPYAAFAEAALKKRSLRRPKKPPVSLVSVDRLLLSAARTFPLVTIHTESIDPNVCRIGRVLDVNRGRVSMLEINPDATWEEKPTEYRLNKITRVNFGGDYEDALHLVGDKPGRR